MCWKTQTHTHTHVRKCNWLQSHPFFGYRPLQINNPTDLPFHPISLCILGARHFPFSRHFLFLFLVVYILLLLLSLLSHYVNKLNKFSAQCKTNATNRPCASAHTHKLMWTRNSLFCFCLCRCWLEKEERKRASEFQSMKYSDDKNSNNLTNIKTARKKNK